MPTVANPRIDQASVPTQFAVDVSALQDKTFDFIIVGAGSAGCVLAEKLSRVPTVSVLLLETGAELQDTPLCKTPSNYQLVWQSEADWGYISAPQQELPLSGEQYSEDDDCERVGSGMCNRIVLLSLCRFVS